MLTVPVEAAIPRALSVTAAPMATESGAATNDPIDGPLNGPGISGQNGSDNTTIYNYAYVTINAAVLKAGQTGV